MKQRLGCNFLNTILAESSSIAVRSQVMAGRKKPLAEFGLDDEGNTLKLPCIAGLEQHLS